MRLLHFFLTVILFTSSALIYASVPQLVQEGDLIWQGVATQGGYARIRLPVGAQAQVAGRPLSLNEQGEGLIGFSMTQGPVNLEWRQGGRVQTYRFAVQNRQFDRIQVRTGDNSVPLRLVDQFDTQIDRATSRSSNRNDWRTDFVWPVVGELGQRYGSQRIYNGGQSQLQAGISVIRPNGTPVIAPLGGLVSLVAGDERQGMLVVIDHGHALYSVLSNLQRVDVREGQVVRQGALLGQVGPDRQQGRHYMQWQVRWQGQWLDPLLLLEPQLAWPRISLPPSIAPAPTSARPVPVVIQTPSQPELAVASGCDQAKQLVLLSSFGRQLEWQHYARQLELQAECVIQLDDSMRLSSQQLRTLESSLGKMAIIVQDAAIFALIEAIADLGVEFDGRVLLLDPPVFGDLDRERLGMAMQALPKAQLARSRWFALVSAAPAQQDYQAFYQSFPFMRWFEQRSFDTGIGLIQHAGLHYPPEVWQELRDYIRP